MNLVVPSGAKRLSVEGAIVRCRCEASETHPSSACPMGVQDGTVRAYWHRNPLRRLIFKMTGRMT